MSSRRRQRQQEQAERVARAQAEARREQRNRRLTLAGAILAAVLILAGVVVGVVLHGRSDASKLATDTTVRATSPSDFGSTPCPKADGSSPQQLHFSSPPKHCIVFSSHYVAEFQTSAGNFSVALDSARAPVTVNNFVVLALYHFYNGTTFHRIIPGYMVQGGDPTGKPAGTGSPGYTIHDELPSSVADYKVGSVAMANTGQPDSGGGQFFIWVGPTKVPTPTFSLFGQVTTGMDVVDRIMAGGTASGAPASTVTISTVTIGEADLVTGGTTGS